jgi:hypothetical protein
MRLMNVYIALFVSSSSFFYLIITPFASTYQLARFFLIINSYAQIVPTCSILSSIHFAREIQIVIVGEGLRHEEVSLFRHFRLS